MMFDVLPSDVLHVVPLAASGITPDAILSVLRKWAPLALLVLPSLLVGLTDQSKAPGVARWAKAALNFFSILTHRDAPGTLQLPLGLSRLKASSGGAAPSTNLSVPRVPGPLLVLLLGMLTLSASCANWTKADTQGLLKGVIDCTVGPLFSATESALPLVTDAIKGNTEDWKKKLETIGIGYGTNAVACAVKRVYASLNLPAALTPDALAAKARAESYLKEKKIPLGQIKIDPR
jgi:hypothetical protein